jgi:hypothetical protein
MLKTRLDGCLDVTSPRVPFSFAQCDFQVLIARNGEEIRARQWLRSGTFMPTCRPVDAMRGQFDTRLVTSALPQPFYKGIPTMPRDEDDDLYDEEFDFVDDDESDDADDEQDYPEEAATNERETVEEASDGASRDAADEFGFRDDEPVDEYGRPEPAANYVVHIYELKKFKRTIDRPFTPEDAEAFATEYNRTSKPYQRFAVAGKNDAKPKKSLD